MQGIMAKERKTKRPASHPWPVRLKRLREQLDITQVEAAERAGVSAGAWIAWENNFRRPGRIAVRLLRQAFPDLK